MTDEPTARGSRSELVWYAAYGSNLLADRFRVYLTGGPVPHRPTPSVQAGARNPTPPRAGQPWELGHELFFAGRSPGWGDGAVAFIDPNPLPTTAATTAAASAPSAAAGSTPPAVPTAGRIWLITAEQFEDVFRQENGMAVPGSSAHPGSGPGPRIDAGDGPLFDLADIAPGQHLDVGDRWYGRVLHLGPGPDGYPVATFTGADPGRHRRGPAHLSYLRTVGLGLMETWGLSSVEAAARLAACDGNLDAVDAATLAANLQPDGGPS